MIVENKAGSTADTTRASAGNYLVSEDERRLVDYLREKNLDRTNAISAQVNPENTIYTRYIKRLLDILIAFPIFVITLPINLVLGICTYFDVGRPIFYKQTRCGKDGKMFTMIKFRNMTNETDKDGKLLPAKERVTKFGRIMRKYSLDELLNFWNVLKGDMSIIGPRPLPAFFSDRMSDRHKMRYVVRPGLECPRIIEMDESVCPYHHQFENDIWYVENVGLKTDVFLIVHLVKMTLFSSKIRKRNADGASYFVGYDEEGQALSLTRAKRMYGNAEE